MCGIFGVTHYRRQEHATAQAALNTITYRGPDGWGETTYDGVYQGHRRLAIIDLSELGKQPMQTPDEQLIVSLNGEIYNYRELKQDLEAAGFSFVSASDTEVLLHGYRAWGLAGLLEKIEGMYAFVLQDRQAQKVHLVRDHAGIKPLYYGLVGDRLSWASELKALTSFFGTPNLQVDETAVYDFLTYLHIPAPKSLYKGIYKLQPGEALTYDLDTGNHTTFRHWQVDPLSNPFQDAASAQTAIKKAIYENVHQQLVADVPVGFFLSGGIDSSIVCTAARPHVEQMITNTIGLQDKDLDESDYARLMATKLGTKHREGTCPRDIVNQQFSQLAEWTDEPFGDLSIFPTSQVSKLGREAATVILTGDGGDELFGGYDRYQIGSFSLNPKVGIAGMLRPVVTPLREALYGTLPGKVLNRLENFTLADPVERYAKIIGGMIKHDKAKQNYRQLWEIPADYDDYWLYRAHYRADLPFKTQAQLIDFYGYLQMVLTKVDRASMRHSLETRVPLLSRPVITAAFNTPEKFIYANGWQKGVLKKAFADEIPADILHRPKRGFAIERPKGDDALNRRDVRLPELILQSQFAEVLEALND